MTLSPFLVLSLRFKSLELVLLAVCGLSFASCSYKNQPANHTQRCATASSGKRCPSGYHCGSDSYCWRDGTDPDGGTAGDAKGTGGAVATGSGGGGATGTGTGGATDGGEAQDTSVGPGSGGSAGADAATMCMTGMKLCGGSCVSISDPAYGCDPITCDPSVCPAVSAGLTLVCQGTACVIGSCPTGTKKCGTKCVSLTDPAYGCGATTCDASSCPTVSGTGTVVCQGTACVIGTCPADTKKCAGKCVSLTDPAYGCGATTCDATSCPVVSGTSTLVCQGTACVIGTCSAGTKKCGDKCVPTDANNGCADAAKCTACAANETCTGTPTTCQCVPNNTAACMGKACGPATNNCGQSITCPDTCTAPNVCGGGSAGVNGCGCTANNTAACTGKACGPATNNCNQAITCPDTCTAPNVCGGGGVGANACGCTANNTAACTGKACGPATNNCNQAITCTNTCGGTTPICRTTTNSCVGCLANTDCSAAKPFCAGTTCVQCMSDANCSSPTPRCSNNACVQCAANTDCTASHGAGSTCNTTSHVCQCRRPSSGNLLMNPGFETNLSGWMSASNCPSCPQLETWDGTSDSDSCPSSGSVRLNYSGFAFGMLAQCVATGPNTYRFGYRFRQAMLADTNAVLCSVSAYTGTSCAGTELASMQYFSGPAPATTTTWGNPSLSTFFVAPATTGSIRVVCQPQSTLADSWVDQVYLSLSGSF